MPRQRQQFDIGEIAEMIEEGLSLPQVADELEVTGGQVARAYYEAELELDPNKAVKGTGAAIEKARNDGLRWERIAVYSGLSVSEVKALWEERTGEDATSSYTGRGRRFPGMDGAEPAEKKSTTSRRRKTQEEDEDDEPKATTTRRRRRSTAKDEDEAPARTTRSRTRAARQARAASDEDEDAEAKPAATTTRRRRRRNPT